ncbi:hypothetical protein EJB05_14086, partial [Eragrostis curvula]
MRRRRRQLSTNHNWTRPASSSNCSTKATREESTSHRPAGLPQCLRLRGVVPSLRSGRDIPWELGLQSDLLIEDAYLCVAEFQGPEISLVVRISEVVSPVEYMDVMPAGI